LSDARVVPGSFRDPAGFVFERDGKLYRQVDRGFGDAFDRLTTTGLYDALTSEGLLLPHREAPPELAATGDAYRVIEPERLAFVSYPYEWCFGQWKDAALVTLRAQARAMGHGMTLRDASAFNVQLHRGRPVLIDSLSFEPLREGEPWRAYAQFCQHFLAPLAIMSGRDVRLGQLFRAHVDGIPLDLAASLLPRRTKVRPGVWLHLVAHGRSQARHGAAGGTEARGAPPNGAGGPPREDAAPRRRRFSMNAFRGLVQSLERAVAGLSWDPPRSVWSGYYGDCHTYGEEALRRKEEVVAGFVEATGPRSVWDLGANTGRFSRLASDRGIFTLALDSDPAVVERTYREARGDPHLLPLLVDVANPSPGIGWANRERMTLAERGPADLVLALALVHHLAIRNDVPLDRLAGYLARLGERAVVEWVPRDDSQVRQMLSTRDHAFDRYTEEGFLEAFARRFEILGREPLPGSGRELFLMRRRP
jgi:hypothetical protein